MTREGPCLLYLLFLSLVGASFSSDHLKAYIIYLGPHSGVKTTQQIQSDHHSLLFSVKNSEDEVRESLLYSYKNSIDGFAALLTESEATRLSEMEEVVSAFPSQARSLHTTRSWDFLGFEEGLHGPERDEVQRRAKYGKDVIIGMLDTGVWPESRSFSDEGLGPIPKHWRGICQEGDAFNSSHCNKKLIGARYYLKGYESYYGALNTTYAFRSPRDHDGHGTHTSSTVAGRVVPNVSALGGFAGGNASGGVPLARLAMYKVCWSIPGPNPNLESTCFDADMLAAIDDAIGDGVHVLSISIGAVRTPSKYPNDGIALGALHAVKNNIVVACSGGNSGPGPASVSNLAPWLITVGASSIDRSFDSPVLLGNGKILKVEGHTVTPYRLNGTKPLVYAGDVEVPSTLSNSGQCLPNSLLAQKVTGKVVLCIRGLGSRLAKGLEVKRAGGVAIILGNTISEGNEVGVDPFLLPGTAVSWDNANTIWKYIKSTRNPMAAIGTARTVLGVRPAPVMTAFSSRGPNRVEPNILKPDITAPGQNILAAWSEASPPTKLDIDSRKVKYNLMSGTSMSCPHVAATAALLRSLYPKWSSAAIRSAMMTTATVGDVAGGPLLNADGKPAGPMDLGSGHLRPVHSADPGLVYDASYTDYLLFACASTGGGQLDHLFPCPSNPPATSDLNYPSVAVTGLNGTATVRRTVTNVGRGPALYRVSILEPAGVSIHISPKVLHFNTTGDKQSFVITLKADGTSVGSGEYVAGSYTWSDGIHVVRSPVVVSLA